MQVSNKTLPTLLGELTDKPYPLSFLREIEGTKSVSLVHWRISILRV